MFGVRCGRAISDGAVYLVFCCRLPCHSRAPLVQPPRLLPVPISKLSQSASGLVSAIGHTING